jgi:hypothetical protein
LARASAHLRVWSWLESPERRLLHLPSPVGKQETANARALRLEFVEAMLFYNFAAAMVLMYAGIRFDLRGAVLWPVIVLHLGLGVWCVSNLWFTRKKLSRG